MYYYKETTVDGSISPKLAPKIGEIIFVTIRDNKSSEIITYCDLLEYPNIEGLLLATELDRRSRNDKRQIRVSKKANYQLDTTYPVYVLAVNRKEEIDENGISRQIVSGIDLSYKKVDIEEREKLLLQFSYTTRIKQLADEFAFLTKIDKSTIYSLTLWEFVAHENDSRELFYKFLRNPDLFCVNLVKEYPEQCESFIQNFKQRITFTAMTMEQPFELQIMNRDALTKLKYVLEYTNPDAKVECISSPKYKILANGYTREECDAKIISCWNEIFEKSKQFKCIMKLDERFDYDPPKKEENEDRLTVEELAKIEDSKQKRSGIIKKQELFVRPLQLIQTPVV